jgi:hypothetical protein
LVGYRLDISGLSICVLVARYLLACQPFSPIPKNQYLVVLTIF